MSGIQIPDGLSPREQILWAAQWNPAEHPRGPDGKFIESSIPGPGPGELSDEASEALSKIDELVDEGSSETDTFEQRSDLGTIVSDVTGVDARFRGELEKSGRAAKELIRLDEAGMLDRLNEFRYSMTDVPSKNASGHYDKRSKSVSVNPEIVEGGELEEWKEQGHIGGSSIEWIIRHEVGHHNHVRSVRSDETETDMKAVRKRDLSDSEVEKIQSELSDYGASKTIEFIAESYARKLSGGSLSDELEQLYSELGGPKVEK